MNLFFSESDEVEIFIKLWEKCPTACNSCSYAHADLKFYDKEVISKNIKDAVSLTWPNIRFFLYGTDSLKSSDLKEILDLIYNLWRTAMIQLDFYNIDANNKLLSELSLEYNWIEFLIARMIKNKDDLICLLESFKRHTKEYPNIYFRYDIIIDIKKYWKAFELILKMLKNVVHSNMHDNYSFTLGKISGCISKAIQIDVFNKRINDVSFKSCVLKNFFAIKEWWIQLFDSIEIDQEGNIRIHTPLCFLWDIKISNIKFSQEKIMIDFSSFEDFLLSRNYSDMWKACYECINTPYKYKEV